MPDLATLTISGPLARLTLSRPEARNALSIDLLAALHARLDDLAGIPAPAPHVLILSGDGKAFCAGMDLKEVLSTPDAPARLLFSLAEFTLRLRALPCMTIASVNGAAIGGGCGLACVCDFAITHAEARLGFPEVDLGVCPAVVAPWLVRKVGPGPARRILLTGGLMSGTAAHAAGIVDDLAPTAGELEARVQALTEQLLSGGAEALRATKALLNGLDGSSDGDAVRKGAELSARVINTAETRAALQRRLDS